MAARAEKAKTRVLGRLSILISETQGKGKFITFRQKSNSGGVEKTQAVRVKAAQYQSIVNEIATAIEGAVAD